MSSQFKWEGNVLRGPFKLLVGKVVDLPRGPPESAPFNTGEWSLSFEKKEGGWILIVYWSSNAVRAKDFSWEWSVAANTAATIRQPNVLVHTQNIGGLFANHKFKGSLTASPQAWNVDEHVAAESEFRLTVKCESLSKQIGKTNTAAIASYIHKQMRSPHSGDVGFVFPKSNQTLWASSETLKEESPYFNNLLTKQELPQQVYGAAAYPTAIDEDDEITIKLDAELATKSRPDHTFHSITVDSPSYSTFASILIWIITKHIIFQPVDPDTNSSDSSDDAPSPSKRAKVDPPAPLDNPYLLPTATWKSAYRAAHLFEINALQKVALDEFKRTLTVETVAGELFSSLSAAHRDVRQVAMEFAVNEWVEVKASKGLEQVEKLIYEGKVEKGAEIAFELARRV